MTGSTKRAEPPLLIGIAGGSGSGKTYFANDLRRELGGGVCEILYQDNFYIDQSRRFDYDGGSVNFDHPDSLDFARMAECLGRLKSGTFCEVPIYDFATHSRRPNTIRMEPKPVILVDGILILHSELVRAQLDRRLFFETPEALRFSRRLKRDVTERGRTEDGVLRQFETQVKPMHDRFVEPSKTFADTLVRESNYRAVLERLVTELKK